MKKFQPIIKKICGFTLNEEYGMGRLGIKDVDEYKEVIDLIQSHDHLVFEGVFTHFACADEPGYLMNKQQAYFEGIGAGKKSPIIYILRILQAH